MAMREVLSHAIAVFDVGVILYFIALNTLYLTFTAIAFFELRRRRKRWTPREISGIMQSPATPPISIVLGAFNEQLTVVASVRSLLALNYPAFEVVVVNDGSADNTLAALQDAYGLVEAPLTHAHAIPTQRVRGVYRSPTTPDLVVIDKVNGGSKADAINAGLNAAKHPLVCVIDADSLLDNDALVRVVLPFIEDARTVAVGGMVRVANGCTIEGGRVTEVRLPRNWLARFQVVEYLRAFLAGRVAHSALNALLIISGGFGLFRRDVLLEVGGFAADSIGEDMELVARIHRHCLEQRRPYRIVFLTDPVCWTEVPESARGLALQRNRWHRGTLDVLRRHAVMIGNPKYKRVGLLASPYYALFEAFGPVVEGLGYAVTIVGACFGLINWPIAKLMFLAALVYGILISVGAVLLEDVFFRRYRRLGDLLQLLLFGVVENFGYRQLTMWWRIRGWVDFLRNKGGWTPTPRKGFARA
jgi:cellulose synthase/poly-beta-1,6-N-acetylglucosamine synthase-like glycosyltransferase